MYPAAARLNVAILLLVTAAFLLGGCRNSGAVRLDPSRPSLSQQLKKQDEHLVGQRFRTMLDFETDADRVFVGTPGRRTSDASHTGSAAFEADSGDGVEIKVDSLLFGTELPGKWTLLGAYVRPGRSGIVTTSLLADGQVVARNQRQAYDNAWVFAGVDLTAADLAGQLRGAQTVRMRIEAHEAASLVIDNVLLVDNAKPLVSAATSTGSGWTIAQRGFALIVDAPARFRATYVSSSGNPGEGFGADEISSLRLRLTHRQQPWTLYPDGRLIKNGKMELLGKAPRELLAAHDSPAEVHVQESMGRLDQATDGDADNDGYNELRGAHQVVAKTPRLSLQIVPAGAPVVSPVLEIRGLPAGRVSAMVEGRLIESTARLPDGTALVTLPLRIERPTVVTVKTE